MMQRNLCPAPSYGVRNSCTPDLAQLTRAAHEKERPGSILIESTEVHRTTTKRVSVVTRSEP